MRLRFQLTGALLPLSLVLLVGCGRQAPPAPPAPVSHPVEPWTWHVVGGLLVLEGEVAAPTEVTLKGQTLNVTRTLAIGPVRWELYRPPKGEVAELRGADGQLLARWDFDVPMGGSSGLPKPTTKPANKQAAKPVLPPVPAKPVPAPIPPKPAPKPQPKPQLKPVPPPVPTKPLPAPKPVPPAIPAKPMASPKPVPPPIPAKPAPQPAPVPPAAAKPVPAAPAPQPAVPASAGSTRPGSWPGAGEALNLLRGPKGARRICMTFDGGSTCEVAAEILDLLKQRGIRTTFFLTGAFIQKYPDLVRRMDREGHEMGNHSLTHPHFAPAMKRDPRWTRDRFQGELLDTDRIFFQLLGRPMAPLWRAPFGEQTAELRAWAEEIGYRHVGWSEGADTLDWATVKERRLYRTGNAILDRLYARMEKQDGDGLIVLMHLGSGRPAGDRPAGVLGPFLDRASKDGWHFVTIGEYLKGMGKPAWDPARRIALLAPSASIAGPR